MDFLRRGLLIDITEADMYGNELIWNRMFVIALRNSG